VLLLQPKSGLGHPIVEVSRSQTVRHTAGRTPLNEWSAHRKGRYLHNTQQTPMPSVRFESAILAVERLKTYALDRMVTGIGSFYISLPNVEWIPAWTLRNSLRWSEKNMWKRCVLPGYTAILFCSGKTFHTVLTNHCCCYIRNCGTEVPKYVYHVHPFKYHSFTIWRSLKWKFLR
jgi:hypothetical protein